MRVWPRIASPTRSPIAYARSSGAHLPPPEISPMIARELTEFFAGFPDGLDDSAFLSKVNASHKRAC